MLHRFAKFVAASTVVLILAGSLVTSHDAGLSVPDWPTSYGWNMFTFPPSLWVANILYEHGHRLIATTVGLLTIVLAAWLWLADSRRWVRWLGVAALAAVIAQGVLGGVTVLFFLPPAVSTAHAALAEIFFCLTVSIALFTSPGWTRGDDAVNEPREQDAMVRRLATTTTAVVYVQILVGAAMRHTGAGLAIPDFPLMFGGIVPDHWSPAIAVHFAHRAGAVVVAVSALATIFTVRSHRRRHPELWRPALLLAVLVVAQATLGALTVLSRRDPWINSFHVVGGALVLMTSLVITLRAWRTSLRIADCGWRTVESALPTGEAGGEIHEPESGMREPQSTIRNPQSAIRNPQSAMKAASPVVSLIDTRRARSLFADYLALTKPRLNFLVVVTSAAGFYLGATDRIDLPQMLLAAVGTALVAGGAAVLNQVAECETDALMRRTRLRPLPDGRVRIGEARMLGLLMAAAGLGLLAARANPLSAALALATLIIYLVVYTPLKRRTSMATIVGAIPGALPALIGWTASHQKIAAGGAALFAIVFLWQVPHFMAISWLYRDDYGAAGFPMLTVIDPDGRRAGRQALLFAVLLLPAAAIPSVIGLSGAVSGAISAVLGIALVWLAIDFSRERTDQSARHLFLGSIMYLPVLWIALIADKL